MIPLFLRAAACALPLLFAAACGASSKDGDNKPAAPSGQDSPAATDITIGSADAKVTVIEYASVTCPHCATFHEQAFPAIKADLIDTGKVRFIFREFPTPPAEFSYIGSMLARCAADKGGTDAYYAVLSALFRTQRTWISANGKAELLKIAAQANMNEADFNACIQRKDLLDLINANVEKGTNTHQVNATPSFIINGKAAEFRTFDEFRKQLDEAVEKASG